MDKELLKFREISWLYFNSRVLQEAKDPNVPLIERLKFLGIFSSNLDEFFRVRVANLRRLMSLGNKGTKLLGFDPTVLMETILQIIRSQQEQFEKLYKEISKELVIQGIYILDHTQITKEQGEHIKTFFKDEVLPNLYPILLENKLEFPYLKDNSIYLVVRLRHNKGKRKDKLSLIEIPVPLISRFFLLPQKDKKQSIVLLDDVVRYCLKDLFSMFKHNQIEAWTLKITRDAELDIEVDLPGNLIEKISSSLKKRKTGTPVRLAYDSEMPEEILNFIVKRMHLKSHNLLPGGRYHNFKDFISFPVGVSKQNTYKPWPDLPHPILKIYSSVFSIIRKQDCIVHFPYQSFDYILQFLREASLDPKTTAIRITLYRLAVHGNIVNALINAVKNGKKVIVILELQARFDEEANIAWAKMLKDEGATVIYEMPGYKIHSKCILVSRMEKRKEVLYANINTGNYNSETASLYADHSLFTKDLNITREIKAMFGMIENQTLEEFKFKHILVSPINFHSSFLSMIQTEIQNARDGKPSWLFWKANHLTDKILINELNTAADAGVNIRLIIRTTYTLLEKDGHVKNRIKARSILDRYLEHARVYAFCNNGEARVFIASADLMSRNMFKRIELGIEINDKFIKQELLDMLEIQWKDNTKSRSIDSVNLNKKVKINSPDFAAQKGFYDYLKEKRKESN